MNVTSLLYVEDDPRQREALATQLRAEGFRVKAVASGRAGLQALKRGRPDVVLCDLNMPRMNGLDVLRRVKAERPELPVVLLTAHGSVDQAVAAIKEGAYDFLLKPLEIHRVVTTVRKALEHTRLQRELASAESNIQRIMENVPDLIYSLDTEGRFLNVSPASETLLGYTPRELVGASVFQFIHPEDRDRIRQGFERAMKRGGKTVYAVEFRMVTKSGEVKYCEVNRRLVFEDDRVVRQDGIIRDVTQRKQLELELQRYSEELEVRVEERTKRLEEATRQLAALNAASNRFTQIHDETVLFNEVPAMLCRTLDFDRATLLLHEGGRLKLRSYCMAKDPPELVKKFIWRLSRGTFMPPHFLESFEQNKTVFISNLDSDPRWPRDPTQAVVRTKSLVVSPIRGNRKPIGILVGNMQHHQREMDPQDVARFETFTNMVGLALDNIRAYQSLERQVMEKTRTLREVNRELRRKARELEQSTYSLGNANVQLLAVQEELERKNADMQRLLDKLAETNRHLHETQAQLVQSEKMASLGMLVAGIAHEINTPIGAVHSMHDTLQRALDKLRETLESSYGEWLERDAGLSRPLKVIAEASKVIESGSTRVIEIVRRLRSFARLDEAELKKVDLHEGLEDTLSLIRHELKHSIQIKRNYGDLPPIACFPGRLNQVFLNLLINAKQAIRERGEITITTSQKDDEVHIVIEDTGTGIPHDNLSKIFDPGFTTKGVGVGTGLGLSIVYQIVQEHKGRIEVKSDPGKGTTFTVALPMNLDKLLVEDTSATAQQASNTQS